MVEHTGSTGGYRAVITRFPAAHTSFVALCNVSTADPAALMHRVADVVLAGRFTKPAPPPVNRAAASRAQPVQAGAAPDLARLAGSYYSDELDATYQLTSRGGVLFVQRPRGPIDTLTTIDATTFRHGGMTLRFAPGGNPASSFAAEYGRVLGIVFVRRDGVSR